MFWKPNGKRLQEVCTYPNNNATNIHYYCEKQKMKDRDIKHRQRLKLAFRLPSYKPVSILLRVTIISLIAVGVLLLISNIVGKPEGFEGAIPFIYYVVIVVAFNVSAEVQIVFDNILERFLPVPQKMKLRISLQILLGLAVLVLAQKIVMSFFNSQLITESSKPGIYMGLISGLFFVYMLANSITIARFTQKWIDSQEEIADMKREKLRMDYNSLQDQLNPHFLFNNLSVLKSLIIYDKDSALKFTENFTDVYRYVLQSRDKQLVKFSNEMEFIYSYIGLHKERIGKGLHVNFSISKGDIETEIAPLTLQLLVENAIKHNIASRETPLEIEISAENSYVTISNNLNLRTSSYSTKTGLQNLVNRYAILTPKKIEVRQDENKFEVRVPLL